MGGAFGLLSFTYEEVYSVERYNKQGFSHVFTNDVYGVGEQLQAYDEHLYIMWNPETNQHIIVDGLVGLSVMKVPQPGFPELNSKLVDHMKRIHTATGFSATQHVDDAETRRVKEWNRKTDDMAENFGRDTLNSAKKIAYSQ